MLLFYIRHGDPIYVPDSLTPLGKRQAEALAKRLSYSRIDTVYSSTSARAIETAMSTCEILKKEPILLDWANEKHAWHEFMLDRQGRCDPTLELPYEYEWFHRTPKFKELLSKDEIRDLGMKWYDHPQFSKFPSFEKGMKRIERETDAFLAALGYEHDRKTHTYRIVQANEKRVAFFAHQGFGWFFISSLLDLPFPLYALHFDMNHTGLTVIDFPNNENGISVPSVLTLSNDSHLFREGLPTVYNNKTEY